MNEEQVPTSESIGDAPTLPAIPPAVQPTRRAVESWRDALEVPAWKHLGAMRAEGWGVGFETTEGEYAGAVERFGKRPVERE